MPNAGTSDKASTLLRAGSAGARRRDARICKGGHVYCRGAQQEATYPGRRRVGEQVKAEQVKAGQLQNKQITRGRRRGSTARQR